MYISAHPQIATRLTSLVLVCTWLLSCSCLCLKNVLADQPFDPSLPDASASSSRDVDEWFEREVRPLLAQHCLSCHSSGLEAPKANLKLDAREFVLSGGDSGPAVIAGQPDESLLLQAVRGEGLQMPPDQPLSKAEQDTLERWIQIGAPWPARTVSTPAAGPDWLVARTQSHWAWQAMRDHAPPQSSQSNWPDRPLDAFVHHQLQTLEIAPADSATRATLLRRLSFDLTGLPPSIVQALEFTKSDDFDRDYVQHVDRMLASPQFGVTWGRHWLDLVRYCETLGHEFDYPIRYASHYRDAVIDSLNSDVPYSQFVSEHLAGDLALTQPRRHPLSGVDQSLALTGWWWMGEALHAPVDVLADEATRLDNQIDVYSKTFLGLTIACARCHDHKFDALSAADYTSLVGILQSSRRTYAFDDPGAAIARHNSDLEKQYQLMRSEVSKSQSLELVSVNDLMKWIDQMVDRMSADMADSPKALASHHPLFPLLMLAGSDTPSDFTASRQKLALELSVAQAAYETWRAQSPLLADFSDGLPDGWYVESPEPRVAQLATQDIGWMMFDPIEMLPRRPGSFVSHALGHQQQLSLRSPTFDLSKPLVALRMRGKSAQSSIVVDNYFMNEFQGLLFGDLRKPIDQPLIEGWVVHRGDLNKYVGHRAYVSIEDDENAWFELSEVRLCDSPPPPQPNDLIAKMLSDGDLSAEELRVRFATHLHAAWLNTFHACSTDNAESADELDSSESAANCCATNDQIDLLRCAMVESQRLKVALPTPRLDREKLDKLAAQTPAPTRLIAVHEGTPRNARLALRGDPHTNGLEVPRSDLQALGGQLFNQPGSSGRRELAFNLTSKRHPLVARVMVNRVWLHLFGQGLVDSPDNFGLLGGAPTHPELLDYLALRFIEHDWSIKWLVREICLSRAYRLSSRSTLQQLAHDPSARMLSHRQVRRLSAEKLRDAMLFVSGSLDSVTSGPSVPVHLSPQMTGRGRPSTSGPLDSLGRRSAFIEMRRNFLNPFLVVFDQPPPATTVGKRNASNVPAQALSMLNDPLVHELAQRWSQRLITELVTDEQRVHALFLGGLSRMPTEQELAACLQSLAPTGLQRVDAQVRFAELAHVLLCTKEFQYLQ